jgi:hypothetical protein
MSSDAALPAVGADLLGAGKAATTGAETGATSGGEAGAETRETSGGVALSAGNAASLCVDSRIARFPLKSLIPGLTSPVPHVAAHNDTLINDACRFKQICASHKKERDRRR